LFFGKPMRSNAVSMVATKKAAFVFQKNVPLLFNQFQPFNSLIGIYLSLLLKLNMLGKCVIF
jgi:hypothetical protein